MNHKLLTREPIDLSKVSELVSNELSGAVSTFSNTVGNNLNQEITAFNYEAYESMALKEIEAICTSVRARWIDVCHIAVHHRLGLVSSHETVVAIAISAVRRQSALEAVGFTLAELRRIVPIWKEELYVNNGSEWQANIECAWLNKPLFSKGNESNDDLQTKSDFIPEHLVQISAVDEEVQRRISCFINKKREEINKCNLKDFVQNDMQPSKYGVDAVNKMDTQDSHFSCARTNSSLVKLEPSKGHLKVRRVDNYFGPQTRPNYCHELDKLMGEEANFKRKFKNRKFSKSDMETSIHERVNMIADYVGATDTDLSHISIVNRIKDMENRILHLESLSPEYRHFMTMDNEKPNAMKLKGCRKSCGNYPPMPRRKHFTIRKLENVINSLEANEIILK